MIKELSIRYLIFFIIFFQLIAFSAKADKTIITNIDAESIFVPDTAFFNEKSEKVYLDQFEGKTVLLVFWATWCGSCADELPILDILQKDFKKLPFEIIAVSEDYNGLEVITKYFQDNEIRHLKIYHDYQNQLFKAMDVAGLPTAFLIDPDGKIKTIFKGVIKWQDDITRELILSKIPGNPELPRNSFKEKVLNTIVKPKSVNNEGGDQKEAKQKEEEKNDDENQADKAKQ